MKVTQVLYSGLGGHASVVFSLIDGDLEHQWDHSLIFYGVEPLNHEYVHKATSRCISINYIKVASGKPFNSWRLFYTKLKATSPDTVLLHSISLLIPAWWYCRKYRRKLISIEHTPNQVKRLIDQWNSALAQYFSDGIIVLTSNYRNELSNILGIHFRKKKTLTIANGIDTGLFCPGKRKKPDSVFKLGMAARFSSQKDQSLLIQVAKKLQGVYNMPFQLLLAGDGEELENVKRLVKDLDVENCTYFLGNLDEKKLIQFYQHLDLYLHASKGETMSTSIMQAMSCGLPIIASDIPGINNLINKDNGILVNHQVNAFVEAIQKLSTSSSTLESLSLSARSYAENNFSNKIMFKSYNHIIQKVCIKEKS